MRTAVIERNTKETQIKIELNLDGGAVQVSTGVGFFDHMLTAFGVHGGFGLKINVTGDLEVDTHHTVEDTGIALGMAFKQALFIFLWMKVLLFVLWIFQTDRFLFLRQISTRNDAVIMKPAVLRNFSVPLQLIQE